MKPKSILLLLAIIVASVCAGCVADKSEATQVMPAKQGGNSAATVPTSNLPPQAVEALKNANSKK